MVLAAVNVELLLSTLKASDTTVGEWINVIGYISSSPPPSILSFAASTSSNALHLPKTSDETPQINGHEKIKEICQAVHVQAIMVWSAGALKVGEYERIVKERKEVERRLFFS